MNDRFGELRKILGLATGIAVCVGSAVGSGILRTPGEVAALLPDAGWIITVWCVGAAVAALDILILAEWAASVPRVGGLVAYLRTAFGRPVAFVFGWLILLITWPGSIASVAVAIGELVAEGPGSLIENVNPTPAARAIAAAVILGTGFINIIGLHVGARFEIALTALKVTLLAGLLAAAAWAVHDFAPAAAATAESLPQAPSGWNALAKAFGGAMISVIFTYDGYADAVYLSGETKNPERSVPRALFISLLVITLLYLFANLAFLAAFGAAGMAKSKFVALELVNLAFGPGGARWLSVAATIVMLGAVNSYLLTGPRIARLLAEERLALPAFGRVSGRGVPVAATLWLVGVSLILTFTNSYSELVDFVVPIVSLTTICIAIGLFTERLRNPQRPRPFRVPMILLVVGAQVALGLLLLINGIQYLTEKHPWLLLADAIALVSGFLLYYFFVRKR